MAAYGCDPAMAANEMMLTKREYAAFTSKDISKNDVLLYQIRQSFKPGEVTPEQAQQIGYELAMTWTKGKHQFVVLLALVGSILFDLKHSVISKMSVDTDNGSAYPWRETLKTSTLLIEGIAFYFYLLTR